MDDDLKRMLEVLATYQPDTEAVARFRARNLDLAHRYPNQWVLYRTPDADPTAPAWDVIPFVDQSAATEWAMRLPRTERSRYTLCFTGGPADGGERVTHAAELGNG